MRLSAAICGMDKGTRRTDLGHALERQNDLRRDLVRAEVIRRGLDRVLRLALRGAGERPDCTVPRAPQCLLPACGQLAGVTYVSNYALCALIARALTDRFMGKSDKRRARVCASSGVLWPRHERHIRLDVLTRELLACLYSRLRRGNLGQCGTSTFFLLRSRVEKSWADSHRDYHAVEPVALGLE